MAQLPAPLYAASGQGSIFLPPLVAKLSESNADYVAIQPTSCAVIQDYQTRRWLGCPCMWLCEKM